MNTDPETGGRIVTLYDRATLASLGFKSVWGVRIGEYKVEAKSIDRLEEKIGKKVEEIAHKLIATSDLFERAHLRQLRADFQRAKTDISIHRSMYLHGGYQT